MNGTIFDDLAETTYQGLQFVLPRADFTYASANAGSTYEAYVWDHLSKRLRPGCTFIDVGANLGLFSLPACTLVGDRGRVIAFEASQENARLLLANANRNKVTNLSLYPIGASDMNGAVISHRHQHATSDKVLSPPGGMENFTDDFDLIPVVRMDDFLSQNTTRIHVMKIDVEGYEYRVIRGAQKLLLEHRPDIYIEYSSAFQMQGSQVEGSTLLKLLGDLGYAFTILHREREPEAISTGEEIGRINSALEVAIASGGTHLDLFLEPREPYSAS